MRTNLMLSTAYGSVVVVGVALAPSIVSAQGDSQWWEGFGPPGIEGDVHVIAVYNAEIYAGGIFTEAGGAPVGNLARWNGHRWIADAEVDGPVYTLLPQETALIAGGHFDEIDGREAHSIAYRDHLAEWYAMGTGMNGPVYALARHEGWLYAAGVFSVAGGQPAGNISRWLGGDYGTIQWETMDGGTLQGPIYCLQSYHSELYIGGGFYGGGSIGWTGYIAYWNGLDYRAVGTGADGSVYDLDVHDTKLYIGGNFTEMDSNEDAQYIARLNWADEVEVVDPDHVPMHSVEGVDFLNGSLVMGGSDGRVFTFVNDQWQQLGGSLLGTQVRDLDVSLEYGLLAAGNFEDGVARWDGERWRRFGGGLRGTITCFTDYGDDLVAGGALEIEPIEVGAPSCRQIGLWNGEYWEELGVGFSDGGVRALTVYDGQLIAGGSFVNAGDQQVDYIARWDGSEWRSFGGGMGLYGFVNDFTMYDGKLIVVGRFVLSGGTQTNRVAAWDGATWSALGQGVSGEVKAVTTYGGELIVGGDFSHAGGQLAENIARWDGSHWRPIGGGLSHNVHALEPYGGDLFAGGEFLEAGGQPATHIARWDGSQWHALPGELSGDDWRQRHVFALKATDAGLFVGGGFTQAGEETVNRIARWEGDTWSALGSGVSGSRGLETVRALHVHDGNLYLGGDFETAGDKPSAGVARWREQVTPVLLASFDVLPSPGRVDIQWQITHTSDPAEFRLEGHRDGEWWLVSHRTAGPRAYRATDGADRLLRGGTIEYQLHAKERGQDWQLLRRQRVTVPAQVTGLSALGIHPNPFSHRTTIPFVLERDGRVRLTIFDAGGRMIRALDDRVLRSGRSVVTWDGTNDAGHAVPSGLYLVRLEIDGTIRTRKALLLR